MRQAEHLIYTLRPDGTSIWLPALMVESLGLRYGMQIPKRVYEGKEIQELIAQRLAAQGKGPRR